MPRKEQRGRLGRRLAIGIYSIALAYLVIVGFASVIPQVFWPEADDSFDLECGDAMQVLYREVEQIRMEYLSSNTRDRADLRRRLKPWDLRLNALRDRCDEEKVHLLDKYRHRVELNLQRHMREDVPLADRVVEALGAESDTTANDAPEHLP